MVFPLCLVAGPDLLGDVGIIAGQLGKGFVWDAGIDLFAADVADDRVAALYAVVEEVERLARDRIVSRRAVR